MHIVRNNRDGGKRSRSEMENPEHGGQVPVGIAPNVAVTQAVAVKISAWTKKAGRQTRTYAIEVMTTAFS